MYISDFIQTFFPWFNDLAFSLGFGLVLAFYMTGLVFGWMFDLVRRS